ncbi:hypothetical protein V490_03466 [Pseudogymnoascus sp. VKM F-3557]|nr:hypothetical protein V490_03466 [Pseudogymnoascus sp. VKM F-3557]
MGDIRSPNTHRMSPQGELGTRLDCGVACWLGLARGDVGDSAYAISFGSADFVRIEDDKRGENYAPRGLRITNGILLAPAMQHS